ncbi:hypothetical protein [Bradyrhizobium liaoningense]|uniref:hypothetical protein n=1 Tax=Bradyrhizobium liaoningense TaxID=43992 RepID=UPI001BAB8E11|nr:hypothetical protein [Bradyrhizobium liaoningense]MBR0719227.1 hypothetical protein [Bradyrhizobium liaoningense]
MLDAALTRMRAHRNNIHRYRRLLRTRLSDLERQFIERRLAEEQTALDALAAETFRIAFTIPGEQQASASLGRNHERRVPGSIGRIAA